MTSIIVTPKIISSLKEAGLDEREINLYVASLTLGEAGMTELSKIAGLKRTSAYVVFESLEKKGLLGSFKTRNGKRFVAKSPSFLLERAQRELQTITAIVPELEALTDKKINKPKITYYEGVENYARAAEDCLTKPNITIRHIGSLSEGHRSIGRDYDLNYFAPTRIKKNIFLKALYFPDVKDLFKNDDGKQLREVRYLPKEHSFKTLTLIYGNKVVISTTKDESLVTVVIESEEIAKAEQAKFDLIWDLSPKK